MAKTRKDRKHGGGSATADPPAASAEAGASAHAKMSRKEYERELRRLHGELVALQEWVKATGREDLHRVRGA